MFNTLRNNFGNITIAFPLAALMGMLVDASITEILMVAGIMWLVAAILLIIDDKWSTINSSEGTFLTENELQEIDVVVYEETEPYHL